VRKVVVNGPGPHVDHVSGVDLLSNNNVNMLASLLTSLGTVQLARRFL